MKETRQTFGLLVTEDYGGAETVAVAFQQRFREVCCTIELVPYFVIDGVLPENVNVHRGYVITGSHYSVNENKTWMLQLEEFIRKIKATNTIRLLGICFGHQIIAKALGGLVARNPNGKMIWGCEKVTVKKEFSLKNYYRQTSLNSCGFYINETHEDQVLELPPSKTSHCKVMGSCQHCPYEIIAYGDHILTLQGHPETTAFRMKVIKSLIIEKNLITQEETEKGERTLHNDESERTMKLICNFLLMS